MKTVINYLKPMLASLICIAFAGMFNANMDIVAHKYSISIYAKKDNAQWYDPKVSWVNKWKLDNEGNPIVGKERFPFSSTILVRFTDFWHLAQSGMVGAFLLGVVLFRRRTYIYRRTEKDRPAQLKEMPNLRNKLGFLALDFVLLWITFSGVFELFYSIILLE